MMKAAALYLACFLLLLSAERATAVDFDTQVMPILTRAGCNAGACHGSAAGRGNFKLSLLGSDPAADFDAITRAFEGRRIHRPEPARSLLLAKPTGALDHGGDVRLEPDGAGAELIAQWIAEGARRSSARKLTRLEIAPSHRVVERAGEEVTLRAFATFDDGPPQDVTPWTLFTPADPSAVTVTAPDADVALDDPPPARARVLRGGLHVVHARFLGRVIPVSFVLPYGSDAVDYGAAKRANFIDEEIYRTLETLRLPLSPPAADAAFARRVSLNLTGRLPSPEVVEQFAADAAADKKEKFVDGLLASEAFVDYWTHRWAKTLQLRSLPNEAEGAAAFHRWLRAQVEQGTPWNRVAHQILTAAGDTHGDGPAYWHRLAGGPREAAERASQTFLGVRLQCAQCHDHPLDRWTQDDYYGAAAIFATIERGRVVRQSPRGAITNPRTGEPAAPRIPGMENLDANGEPPLRTYADWLTADENEFFARGAVNRLWQAMFGRGLVDPVDDLRATNPATHPELFDRLADDFIRGGYDIKRTLRTIALSEAYARGAESVAGNEADDRFYSRYNPRPLAAEVLMDAIVDVTGVPERYAGLPAGARAVMLYDANATSPSLALLGRCGAATDCGENGQDAGLAGALHLVNGEAVNRKIADREGRLHRSIAAGETNREIVIQFYGRALARAPSEEELSYWLQALGEGPREERAARLEDFLWSLLNSREFGWNY